MQKSRVTIQIRTSCVNNSAEALILFSEGQQGLLNLHVHLGWGRFQYGGRGLCYVTLFQGSAVSAGFD